MKCFIIALCVVDECALRGLHLIRVEALVADVAAVFADPCYCFGPGEAIPTHLLKRFLACPSW